MRPDLFPQWGEAFLITLALEVPIYVLGARYVARRRAGSAQAFGPWYLLVAVAIALSAFTHPLLWMLFSALGSWVYRNYTAFALVAETLISLSEGLLFKLALGLPWRPALTLGIAANVFSAGLGPYLWRLLA